MCSASAALRLPPLCFIVLLHAFCRADGDADDLDNTNKSFQEGAFATLYTLTKSRQLDASLRLSVRKEVLEFLQASAGRLGIQCTATAVSSTQIVPAILWMSCMCCTLVGLLGNSCCCPASMQLLHLTLLAALLLLSAALPCSVQHLLPLGHSYRTMVSWQSVETQPAVTHVACSIPTCTVSMVVHSITSPHLAIDLVAQQNMHSLLDSVHRHIYVSTSHIRDSCPFSCLVCRIFKAIRVRYCTLLCTCVWQQSMRSSKGR
jgi:hypothetical protein